MKPDRICRKYLRGSTTGKANVWKSKTQERKYERDILQYQADFLESITAALSGCTTTDGDGRQTVDLSTLSERINEIETRLQNRVGNIADTHTRASYIRGSDAGDRALREALTDAKPRRR